MPKLLPSPALCPTDQVPHQESNRDFWEYLQALPDLAQLSVQSLQAMAMSGQWVRLGAMQSLPHALDLRRWYLLVSGRVCVRYFGMQGRELVLSELNAGQWCSGGRVDGAGTLSQAMAVQTVEPCVIAYWTDEAIQDLLRAQPELVWTVLQSVQKISCNLLVRLVEMGTLNVRARVLARLLMLAEAEGVVGNSVRLVHPPTQAHLAAILSCSREEVAREMSRLAGMGLLHRQGRSLWLDDVQGLRELQHCG